MNIGVSRTNRRTSSNSLLFPRTNNIRDTETNVILPLPENINEVTQIAYSESPVLGGANALQAVGGVLGTMAFAAQGRQRSAGQQIGQSLTNTLGGPAFNDVIASSGITPNQMLTVLLQGPRYKTHSFTWKLYPKNAQESLMIKNIVNEFKIKSRPGTNPNRQYFTFPRLFNLSFCINGKSFFNEYDTNNYLFAFKPAVLEGISVNYTPSGQPSLYKGTGAPDGIEMTLNFKEVEYWLQEDDVGFVDRGGEFLGEAAGNVQDAAEAVGDFFANIFR
jgi:hypothetical protein